MMSFDSIARRKPGMHPASAELMVDFLTSKEGQKMVGEHLPEDTREVACRRPLFAEKLAPKETFTVFPNSKMLESVQDSVYAGEAVRQAKAAA